MLIDRGAIVDGVLSAAVDDLVLVEVLLKHGARIAPLTSGQGSALTDAAGGGNVQVVRLLLAHADEGDLASSADALHWAAAAGRVDAAKILIEHGFDVNRSIPGCDVGETPLLATCAVRKPSPTRLAVAKLLIEHGADAHHRGQGGQTAADLLLRSELKGTIQVDGSLLQKLTRPSGTTK